MKIAVCVKICDGELTAFDSSALEEALRVENAEISIVSMGPPSIYDTLKKLTRLGVKNVYLLSDNVYSGSDTLATAYVLSNFFKQYRFDAIFSGRRSYDGDTGQTMICTSSLLGIPFVGEVMKISFEQGKALVETRTHKRETSLPAIFSFEKTAELRFPSIFSHIGEVTVLSNKEICADPQKCGLSGSPTRVVKTYERDAGRRHCKYLSPEKFFELIEQLKTAPVNVHKPENIEIGEKLGLIWAAGDEAYEKVKGLAKKAEKLQPYDPDTLSKMIINYNPDAVFFPSNEYGRITAATLQAMLNTGLCADVTELSVEDGILYMFRPARGGSVYAKIKCLTSPSLATLRTSDNRSDIIVSGGKGVKDFTLIHKIAERVGGNIGASRGAVDKGSAPYENQIGLTGEKAISKIYIAIGISGAVQHTCAIEDCNFVIAVNPDKNARIFDYSDYGFTVDLEELIRYI